MSDADKYATEREILDGQAPFPEQAYHDPSTGMFVMPDPEPTVKSDDMVKDPGTGLFLPRPAKKIVTAIFFVSGLRLDVSEPYEDVLKAVSEHKTGDLHFTGPIFANDPVVVRSSHVKSIIAITTDWRDLEEIELQMQQRDYATRMAKLQTGKPSMLDTSRERQRNRRHLQ